MTARSNRKKISRHERRVATELGGRKTFASGAGDEKGDGRVAQRFAQTPTGVSRIVRYPLRIENKLTSHARYTMTALDWSKLADSAARLGEHPLFHITLSVPGLGGVELALITQELAVDLGLSQNARPWERGTPARSYSIAWARWLGGPPMCIVLENIINPQRKAHHIMLLDYQDVFRALKERQ